MWNFIIFIIVEFCLKFWSYINLPWSLLRFRFSRFMFIYVCRFWFKKLENKKIKKPNEKVFLQNKKIGTFTTSNPIHETGVRLLGFMTILIQFQAQCHLFFPYWARCIFHFIKTINYWLIDLLRTCLQQL